jgi:hypothetical protein
MNVTSQFHDPAAIPPGRGGGDPAVPIAYTSDTETFSVRVPPYVIYLKLCTPQIVGV